MTRLNLTIVLAAATVLLPGTAPVSPPLHAQPADRPAKLRLLEQLAEDQAARARLAERRQLAVDRGDQVVPGQLAVKFAPELEEATVAALAVRHRAARRPRPAFADFDIVSIDPARDLHEAARALAAEPGVVYAEPIGVARALYRPNDPLLEHQWNLAQLDLERTWEINPGASSAIVVAVIDEGVAYRNLGNNYLQAPDLAATTFVGGYDFIWDDDVPIDFGGHGTHVTGTIAQSTNNNLGVAGIAFNVSVMPVKALASDFDFEMGAPNVPTLALIAQAVRFAAEQGAKVINMSLGSRTPSTPLRDAIQFATERGAVVVIAAGNSGDAGSPTEYPAAYAKDMDGVIAVGATEYARARALYSNVNDYVELAAPGGDVDHDLNGDGYVDGVLQQTLDIDAVFLSGRFDQFGYFFFEGTSMATPHVAALAALLMDQGVTNPAAVEAALKRFATDLGPAGRDNEYGYGLINPRATLRGLGLAR
jgi:serine protease